MARITMEEQKEFGVFPVDSILLLKIENIEEREITSRDGTNSWVKLNVTFKILDVQVAGDGSPREDHLDMVGEKIYGNVPFRFTTSPENKLRMWAEAIMNMELGVGFELDTDLFIGRQVRGITSQYDKKAVRANGTPFKGHQVESLLPVKGAGAPGAAAPAPAAAAANTLGWDSPPF